MADGITVAKFSAPKRSRPMRRCLTHALVAVAMTTPVSAFAQDPNCPPGAWFCEPVEAAPAEPPAAAEPSQAPEPQALPAPPPAAAPPPSKPQPPRRGTPPVVIYQTSPTSPPP